MKYHLIIASTWEDLQHQVNEALGRGWTLQGGVSSTSHSYLNTREDYWESTYEYAQAMCEPDSA
jgi:hypothetical protein